VKCPGARKIPVKKAIANILYLFLILALAGCNFPQIASPQPGETPTTGEATTTPLPEPLPTGYTDLLQNKITSGEWTLEVGLVTLLKTFTGELQASEAGLGQGVLETEGTGIIRLAGDYLQNGSDQATKDEITRLLNLLVPTQEALDRYSIPDEQATLDSGRGAGRAAPLRQDAENCNTLWVSGFPDARTPSFTCFLFDDVKVAGNIYKVYFPKAWRGDASRDSYFAATLEAAEQAINEYQKYGTVKSIYFVFTTLADERDTIEWTTYASTSTDTFRPGTEACPVIINPAAMDIDLPIPGQPGPFKQIIAHEIFHCFQAWNLRAQLNGPGVDSDWWVEGTAEYFSNLVYKSVDFEYRFWDSFNELSTIKPLTNMDYENFVFFQFWGNRIGPDAVIAMLRTMPTGPGLDAQLTALAAVPGMEDTFEEFARSVIDRTLKDSSGVTIALPLETTENFSFTDVATKDFNSYPFVFSRFKVTFDSGKSFSVETLSGGEGNSAWRAFGSVGGWGPFPATASGGCEDLTYILYVVTTTPAAIRTETVTATMVTEAPCDECLIGRWEATNDSVISYMQSVISSDADAVPTIESITGIMFMDFKAIGTGSGGYDNLVVHETNVGGNAGIDAIYTFTGASRGPYTGDGSVLIGLSGSTNIVFTVNIYSNGIDLGSTTYPFQPEDFPVGSTIPTAYTCTADTLTTWPPVADTIVDPITYLRK
jgi:hypothetical protein